MKRRALAFSHDARRDLGEIGFHLAAEAGASTAAKWVDQIVVAIERLALNAEIGALDRWLGEDRRKIVIRPYIVVYLIEDDVVVILRIVHGARDLPSLFGDTPV